MLGLFWVGIDYFLPRIRVDGALSDSCWKRFQIDMVSVSGFTVIIIPHQSNRFEGQGDSKKKEKEIIVTWGEMHGRKAKQEPQATLVEHLELWTCHNLSVWSNSVSQL